MSTKQSYGVHHLERKSSPFYKFKTFSVCEYLLNITSGHHFVQKYRSVFWLRKQVVVNIIGNSETKSWVEQGNIDVFKKLPIVFQTSPSEGEKSPLPEDPLSFGEVDPNTSSRSRNLSSRWYWSVGELIFGSHELRKNEFGRELKEKTFGKVLSNKYIICRAMQSSIEVGEIYFQASSHERLRIRGKNWGEMK